MSPTDDASVSLQWSVQGDDVASGSLFNHIAGDPNVRQIQRVAPDIVVLSMSPTMPLAFRPGSATVL